MNACCAGSLSLSQLPDSFSANCSGAVSASFWTAATWICECLLRVRSTSGWVMFSFPAMDWTACTRAANSCDSDLAMTRSGPAPRLI